MFPLFLNTLSIFIIVLYCYNVCATPWADADTHLDAGHTTSGVFCCRQLSLTFGHQVSYPNSSVFKDQQNGKDDGYWTQQEASVIPACRFSPRSTKHVSIAVAKLSHFRCKFAVRGGGHMSWAGAANIQDGVTIDLSSINRVRVLGNRTITSVGGGARWQDVYRKLDALNLAVSGGRVYDVGVGGLTTGGGNSFFAPRYGFVCDNVANFEVVLASGQIINANNYEHADLQRALRGGSNNFGIVTRFDLKTFPQGKLWGGFIIYPFRTAAAQLQHLQDFNTASGDGIDPFASVINAYIFTANGPSFIANQYTYTKVEAYPSILKNFTDLKPQLSDTTRITNLTDLTIELGAGTPNGFRQLFATATFTNNAVLFAHLLSLATTAFAPLQAIKDFQASFVLQPVPRSITSKSFSSGGPNGNSLGLDNGKGDLVWLDITIQYSPSLSDAASADAAITKATQSLLTKSIAYAKSRNLYNRFIYLNYALKEQDPIAGYGRANQAFLRQVSEKYDPQQVFQKLVPGGFNLWRRDEVCCQ